MAKTKYEFDLKMTIEMPKVEGKVETKKMQAAIRTALSKGQQKGAAYVEKSLRKALDGAVVKTWPYGGESRDIVESGRLRSSLQIKTQFLQTKTTFKIVYAVPYAGIIHYGGMIKPYGNQNAADVVIPGRPWVTATLQGTDGMQKFDMKTPFDKGISEAWKAQFG